MDVQVVAFPQEGIVRDEGTLRLSTPYVSLTVGFALFKVEHL